MEDIGCPRCKTTKYRKATLKLLVNVCGHALCDNCVELLFSKGSGACPECGIPLKRVGFRVQLFEDPLVEKEVEIRRRLLRDYCKTESDFPDLRSYNDYLEEIENLVFSLVYNRNALEANKRIEAYKKENKEQISKARSRLNPKLLELEALLEEERLLNELRLLEKSSLEKDEKLKKMKTKEDLIDDLMFSEGDAASIVSSHKDEMERKEEEDKNVANELVRRKMEIRAETEARLNSIKTHGMVISSRPQFSTGISTTGVGGFLPVPKREEELFTFVEPEVENRGPIPPTIESLKSLDLNFSNFIDEEDRRERAAGYFAAIEMRRTLADAFSEIYYNPKTESAIQDFTPSNQLMDTS